MNMQFKKIILIVFALFIYASSNKFALSHPLSKLSTDFSKLIVFTSSKPFTSIDGSIFLNGTRGDGIHFQKEILQRSDDEIEQDKAKAIEFFSEKFGIDISKNSVYFTGFEIAADDRAVVISGEYVPPQGWKVFDGGWTTIVTDPNGLDLGGNFSGTHVPQGTFFTYGNYYIQKAPYPILLGYRSKIPSLPGVNGSFQVISDVFSNQYGFGQVIGGAFPQTLPRNKMIFNARGVITFPTKKKYQP
jgi:hypothetical protein